MARFEVRSRVLKLKNKTKTNLSTKAERQRSHKQKEERKHWGVEWKILASAVKWIISSARGEVRLTGM